MFSFVSILQDINALYILNKWYKMQFFFVVSIATEYLEVFLMCLVPNYSVVICGTVDGQCLRALNLYRFVYKVAQYSLTTGAEIYRDCFPTQRAPSGMAMVTVAGTQCLAFSYE